MAPTSTTTKTQTQLGFDPSTSHMVRAIASLDTFTVVSNYIESTVPPTSDLTDDVVGINFPLHHSLIPL